MQIQTRRRLALVFEECESVGEPDDLWCVFLVDDVIRHLPVGEARHDHE